MIRWAYYTRLSFLDLIRLWPGVQSHLIVVVGICLPLLILLGLKRGHVAGLREELLRSPTGREIKAWHAQKGELLTQSAIGRLARAHPAIEIIIPDEKAVGALAHVTADGKVREVGAATLYATAQGDPVLALYKADVIAPGERAVVLTQSLARKLDVEVGGTVSLTVRREGGESATVDLLVAAVTADGGQDKDTGYLDVQVLAAIRQYYSGHRVAAFNWPSSSLPVKDLYAGYLLFCEPTSDISAADREALDRLEMVVEPIEEDQARLLYGLVTPGPLKVYFLHTHQSHRDPRFRINHDPKKFTSLTQADDIPIFWNPAMRVTIDGHPVLLVGFSNPPFRTWLSLYLADPDSTFPPGGNQFQIKFPLDPGFAPAGSTLRLAIPGGRGELCELAVAPAGRTVLKKRFGPLAGMLAGVAPPSLQRMVFTASALAESIPVLAPHTGPAVGVVPADFLAYLHATHDGMAQFDPTTKRFVPTPNEIDYPSVRMYVRTIHEVPEVEQRLNELGYSCDSASNRILEIRQQDESLGFIVIVVGMGVWAFGVFTVYNVLHDSTARKRGTIGILRVMGMSRAGVFYFVLLRAASLGLLAGAITTGLGALLPRLLGALPEVNREPVRYALWGVFGGLGTLALVLGVWHSTATPRPGREWFARVRSRAVWTCAVLAAAGFTAWGLAWVLRFQAVRIVSDPADSLVVLASALTCCLLGAILPAWKASQADPFEAIIEGKFL